MRELKKASSQQMGTGTPHYRRHSIGSQNDWFSERVPLPTNSGEARHVVIGSSSLITFTNIGRTLPSKWEDAERWICSPVSGNGINNKSHSQLHKRSKSKSQSCTIMPPEMAATHFIHSPFSADKVCGSGSTGERRQAYDVINEPERSELTASDSYPSPKIKNLGEEKNDETLTYAVDVSHGDGDIQVSPIRCKQFSTKENLSLSSPLACRSIREQQKEHSAKFEVRDVQVDKRTTTIKRAKRRGMRINNRRSPEVLDFHENAIKVRTSSFDLVDAAMDFSKLEREEAEIAAWENLQMATAEAAIRKLEMKLEKKRSSSMDKIITKFRTAQIKANRMRGRLSDHESHQVPEYSYRIFSFHRPIRFQFLRHCFTADAV